MTTSAAEPKLGRATLIRSSVKTMADWQEIVIEKFLFLNGFLSVLLIALIFLFLFKEGLSAFGQIRPIQFLGGWSENFFTEKTEFMLTWQPVSEVPKFSLIPLLCGSFLVAVPATLISTFIGVAIGIYLSVFASIRVREFGKPIIEFFNGLPTVVIGFFFLTVVAGLVQKIFGTTYRLNAFVGALGVSVVTIPLIASLTEDSLQAVPKELKAASLALGTTPWQTVWNVTLPAAVSGITASVLLGLGRALGETMIVLMATGNGAVVTGNIFSTVRTMTATIAAELGSAAHASPQYYALFLVGSILFSITFVFNAAAEHVVYKLREKLRM
jgi:phosphate transport system permease protein